MNLWFKFSNPTFEVLFCENLDKPEMECHGCCMMKKINQTPDQKADFSLPSILPGHELSTFIVSNQLAFVKKDFEILNDINQTYLFSYHFNLLSNCFHPPEAIQA